MKQLFNCIFLEADIFNLHTNHTYSHIPMKQKSTFNNNS